MTIRNLNYTGRTKIPRNEISLRLNTAPDGETRFNISLSLSNTDFEGDPKVGVEAYNGDISLLFDCGTVGNCTVPSDNTITTLGHPDKIKFRVKIIKETAPPLILARADGLTPEGGEDEQEDRDSIISVKIEDLGSVAWIIDYPEALTDKPILKISKSIADGINKIKRDPVYAALILPTVVREIFTKIIQDSVEKNLDEDALQNTASWQYRWIQYAAVEMNVAPPNWDLIDDLDDGEAQSYVNDVTEVFSKTYDLLERLVSHEARNQS